MPNGYISGEATKSFSKTSDEATRSDTRISRQGARSRNVPATKNVHKKFRVMKRFLNNLLLAGNAWTHLLTLTARNSVMWYDGMPVLNLRQNYYWATIGTESITGTGDVLPDCELATGVAKTAKIALKMERRVRT
jgi:hypothetical protein